MSHYDHRPALPASGNVDSSVLNLRQESSSRPPAWRWERARLLLENPRLAVRLSGDTDDYTRRAKEFQMAMSRCRDQYDQLGVLRRYPDLFEAHQIYINEKQLVRYEIEARLLANETPERIAKRFAANQAVITWYERLFFNVLDRLDDSGYIANCVMGESLHAGLTERDHDLLWKFYGYVGGSVVLDAVIYKGFSQSRPESADEVAAFLSDQLQSNSALKAMLAMRTMPINSYTQQAIIEIQQRFIEIKQQAESGVGAGDTISSNIQAMLENIPWTIGARPVLVSSKDPSKIVGRLPPPLEEADKYAAELRAEEISQINLGRIPERLKYLSKVRFPDQRSKSDEPPDQES